MVKPHPAQKTIQFIISLQKNKCINSVKYWVDFGNCLYELRNYIRAIEAYNQGLQIEPNNKIIRFNLTNCKKDLDLEIKYDEEYQNYREHKKEIVKIFYEYNNPDYSDF